MISLTNLTIRRQKRLLRTIGTIFSAITLQCALGCWSQAVNAEGTREIVKNGGNRPFTEWKNNTTGGILRRTVLKVYANSNEVIYLGSSAMGVSPVGDILLFKDTDNVDTATPQLKCSTKATGTGVLDTRAKEIAGPLPAAGGYTPCTYPVLSSGVYQVVFYGPDGKTGANDPVTVGTIDYIANPLITTDQKSTVSMWDITVRSSAASTSDINGRVFADYIALVMGANNRYLKSNLYILTDDGYRYSTDLSVGAGLDPNGFLFFANDKGLLAPGGQPLYHTGKSGNNAMPPPLDGGVTIQAPKYPIFFNPPSNTTVSGLSVPLTALPPSPPTNFLFTGGAGGSGNQTPKNAGGTFSFNAPQDGGYQIIIDANNDGLYNSTPVLVNVNGTPTLISDRILEGSVNQGFGTAAWDGKDGTATNPVTLNPRAGNAPYNARIILKGGEYHFPLLDAESGKDGFKIQMLNPPGVFSNGASATTIYFDERDYNPGTPVNLGCSASAGLPVCDARSGVDSILGAHKYGNNTGSTTDYGDKKALDTWIYFPSDAVFTPLVITATNQANVQGKKSVKFLTDTDTSGTVTVGDKVEYTITYSNATPVANSDATNFVISDTLPSQLTFVSAVIVSQTSGNTITLKSGYNGSGVLTNTDTLRKGDSITIKIVATINSDNGGRNISNQASATFRTPDNPATTGTVVTDADSAGAAANPPAVNNYFLQTLDDKVNNGNDPTKTDDDDPTLLIVMPEPVEATLRLVKRVTKVGGFRITIFNDDTTGTKAADDNAPGWITSPLYLEGAFNTSQIPLANQPKPKDEVEYTIYFLADGTVNSQNVKICDFIPNNSTYVPNSLQLKIGTGAAVTVTDVIGGSDIDGGFYSTAPFPTACTSTNNGNGAVLVNVGTVNFSTGVGTPANSYGYIRFRAKVK
jgi:fimbrial isopeptide formation D2 family protein/uncharacterized repeat protein (TIGR01451 family)